MKNQMTRSELARKAGVSSEAIRFYERRGLVAEPDRPLSGYRFYTNKMLTRLRFIKNAQRLGFSLREIDSLLKQSASSASNCRGVAKTVSDKIDEIAQAVQRQKNNMAFMERMLRRCSKDDRIADCPIITALENPKAFRRRVS